MAKRSGIDGIEELERAFQRLGKVPQTVATQSARAGARVALKAAKANAPVDTGELKSGIILKRSSKKTAKGSAVFNVMMDPAKNDVFVKTTKDGTRYYYPASQEYGWLTVDGRYIPGYSYLSRAVDDNEKQIEQKVLESAGKAVDKALRKGG